MNAIKTSHVLVALSIYMMPIFAEHQNAHQRLIKIAEDYLTFMYDACISNSVQTCDKRIEILFAPNLTKIDNCSILFENNRELLLPQIQGFVKPNDFTADQAIGTIDTANALIIPSVETNSVTIHFQWTHRDIGTATTTVILQCNSNGQIERIIDVWAKVLHST